MKVFKKIISIILFVALPLLLATIVLEFIGLFAELERLSAYENTSGSDWLAYGITQGMIVIYSFAGIFISSLLTFFNSFKILKYFSAVFVILFIITGILGAVI